MSFVETLKAISVPKNVRRTIKDLIVAKKSISELGKGKRIPAIDIFIINAMKEATEYCIKAPVNRVPIEVVDKLFYDILNEV